MDNFIRQRVSDPRFNSRPVDMALGKRWKSLNVSRRDPPASASTAPVRFSRVNASMDSDKKPSAAPDGSPKKKRRKKASGSGSETDSSSSEDEKGDKSGRCWKGYKPVPGKKPYSDGSCAKA